MKNPTMQINIAEDLYIFSLIWDIKPSIIFPNIVKNVDKLRQLQIKTSNIVHWIFTKIEVVQDKYFVGSMSSPLR